MENSGHSDKYEDPPGPGSIDETPQMMEYHPQGAPVAIMQAQPSSTEIASSTSGIDAVQSTTASSPAPDDSLGFAGTSILRTKINNPDKEGSPELPQLNAFQLLTQERMAAGKAPEQAGSFKQESIKSDPVKQEPPPSSQDSLFVGQNETSNTTTNPHLKRAAPEQPILTAKAPAHPSKKKGNANKEEPYDDEREKHASQFAVDKTCFKNAETLSWDITQKLLRKINGLREPDDGEHEVDNLREKIRKAGSPAQRFLPVWKVGFLGDTASGKSSLINALLNEDEVATASDDGGSGTHVIHEFAMMDQGQTTRYRAVIHYHPGRKIESLVKEHFASYFDYRNCVKEEMDEDSYEELRMKSNTAFEFFYSCLCGPGPALGFQSVRNLEDYLKSAKSAKDTKMIELLCKAIDDYLKTLNFNGGATVIDANNLRDLNDAKRKFSGPVKSNTPTRSPWRLVRVINVHLAARILADGLRLADLPGLSDSDQTRVQSTRDYIKTCSTVIVVHPIPRVTTSDTVEKNLANCIRSGKNGNTVLVCTKTDDFQHDRDRQLAKSDAIQISKLRAEEHQLQTEITELQNQKDIAEEDERDDDYTKADKALKVRNREKVLATAAIRGANIGFRNNTVSDTMQGKIRSMHLEITGEGGEDIQVFCVSNKIYDVHRKGYDKLKDTPDLTVFQTEIPLLRDYLLAAPAKMKHEKLTQACTKLLPGAVLSLRLYCSKSKLERKQDVVPLVEGPMKDSHTQIRLVAEALKHDFNESLNAMTDRHDNRWDKDLKNRAKVWAAAYHARYKKICVKNGKGIMEKFGDDVDWNEEIVGVWSKHVCQAILVAKKKFTDRCIELLDSLSGLLLKVIDSLKHGADTQGMGDLMETFYQAVVNKRDIVRMRVRKRFDALKKQVTKIRHAATSFDDEDSSLVLHGMLPTYAECAQITSTGAHVKRTTIMKKKLFGTDNICLDVMSRTSAAFDECMEEWAAETNDKLNELFDDVVSDFHSRFDNEENEDAQRQEFRMKLLEAVEEAEKEISGPLKAEMDECKQYE